MASTLRNIEEDANNDMWLKKRKALREQKFLESVDAAKNNMNEFGARTAATQTAYGLRNVDPMLRSAQTRADMGLGSREARERRVDREYWQPKIRQEAEASELARTRAQFAEPAAITAKSAENVASTNAGVQYHRTFVEGAGKQAEVAGTLAGKQAEASGLVQGKREEARGAQAIAEAEGISAERANQAALERARISAEGGMQRATISAGGATSRQTEASKVKLGIELGKAQAQAVAANDALKKAQESGDDAKIEQAAKNAAVAARAARNIEEQLNAMGSEQAEAPAGTLRQATQIDRATAEALLREAGGDKDKARKLAIQRGLRF